VIPEADMTALRRSAFDIGLAGLAEDRALEDVTTGSLGAAAGKSARTIAVAKRMCVVCGWFAVEEVFGSLGGVLARQETPDGSLIGPGRLIGVLEGPAGILLRGERVALNILGRLSGIATQTARYVEAVSGTGTEILDTRKTTPGFRLLERYAVRCGGGVNHRFDLSAMALYKDNHLALAGGASLLGEAIRAARDSGVGIEIEVETLGDLDSALGYSPDRILLDNMSPEDVRTASAICRGRGVYAEASGGMTLENVRQYAEAGANGISVGAITHSAPAADISFEMEVGF
jgi:nicotinate-nucleotide pyrophosphorylase (carboxylating)